MLHFNNRCPDFKEGEPTHYDYRIVDCLRCMRTERETLLKQYNRVYERALELSPTKAATVFGDFRDAYDRSDILKT